MALAACGGGNSGVGSEDDSSASVEEVKHYAGSDREDFLLKCAKEEGLVEVYTTQNPPWPMLCALAS